MTSSLTCRRCQPDARGSAPRNVGATWATSSSASRASRVGDGHPVTFFASLVLVLVWGASGPIMDYSDTWQLIINTFTTAVTYLVIFVVQHTQNHDTAALHAKLDELITHLQGPRDELAGIENAVAPPHSDASRD